MKPATLSASSITVADLCMARWEAEYLHYGRGVAGKAANEGTVLHFALEQWVEEAFVTKTREPTLDNLLKWYEIGSISIMGNTGHSGYKEGIQLLKNWFKRTIDVLQSRTVLLTEEKLSFDLTSKNGDALQANGPITFNYIFDRLDQIGDDEYEVVDYKSARWGYNADEMRKKHQFRIYGLAAQIMYPNAKRIWVRADLLRHQDVATPFSREDNVQTWKVLQQIANRILETPSGSAEYTLNNECLFCPIKINCPAIQKNILVGGIFGMSPDQMIDRRAQLDMQAKAVKSAITELDQQILKLAETEDWNTKETASFRAHVNVSARRGVDADGVEAVVGTELFNLYGGKTISVTRFEDLLKDDSLTDEQRKQLRPLIAKRLGEPSIKTEAKPTFSD